MKHQQSSSGFQPLTQNPLTQNPLTQNPLTQNPLTQNPLTQNPLTQNPLTDTNQRQEAAATFFDPFAKTTITKANLPHWRQNSVIYFVTFRLADSLPAEKLAALQHEREAWLSAHPEPRSEEQEKEYWQRFGGKIQQFLDAGHGSCILSKPTVSSMIENTLHHFDGTRYALGKYAIAANHVHVIVTPFPDHPLSTILHSWKSFTANQINKLTGTSKTLWQKESYDHIVRNPKALWNIERYIENHNSK